MDAHPQQAGPDANQRSAAPADAPSLAGFVGGRTFRGVQRVRLGDVDPSGRARLDALARYLQDVANDDAYDSGIDNPGVWVVRRSTIEVHQGPQLREDLELVTFCSGTGACWAERRTTLTGSAGARVEAAVLWVQLGTDGTRPARLGPDFAAVYGESAAGRKVGAGLVLDQELPAGPGRSFALRHADLDVMGHVNNAVYWAMLEEEVGLEEALGRHESGMGAPPDHPLRFDLEHHQAIDPGATVELRHLERQLWITTGGSLAAVASWRPLADQ